MTANGEYAGSIQVEGSAEVIYGFHGRYMLEAMKQFADQERITVEVSQPTAPIVLRAGDGRKTLILPLRVRQEVNQAA